SAPAAARRHADRKAGRIPQPLQFETFSHRERPRPAFALGIDVGERHKAGSKTPVTLVSHRPAQPIEHLPFGIADARLDLAAVAGAPNAFDPVKRAERVLDRARGRIEAWSVVVDLLR